MREINKINKINLKIFQKNNISTPLKIYSKSNLKCNTCIYYYENENTKKCIIFNKKAIETRKNEFLCGKEGEFYREKK